MSVHPSLGMVPVEESSLSHELLDSLQRRLCSSVQYKTSSSNVRVLMVNDNPNAVSALLVAQTSVAGHTLWHYYVASAMQASHTMNRISGYEGSPQHLSLGVPSICYDPDVSLDPDASCHCIPRPPYTSPPLLVPTGVVGPAAVLRNKRLCPLLSLPREIRDHIYRDTLQDCEAILDLEPSRSSKIRVHTTAEVSSYSLILVNRQVSEEYRDEMQRYCSERPLLVVTTLQQKWTRKEAPSISHYVIRLGYLALNMLAHLEQHVQALQQAGIGDVTIVLLIMPTLGDVMPRTTQDVLDSLRTNIEASPLGKTSNGDMKVRFNAIVRQRLEEYSFPGPDNSLVTKPSTFVRFGVMKSLKPPHSLERNAFVVNRHILRINDIRGLFGLLRDYDAPSETEGLITSMSWKHAVVPAVSMTEKSVLEKVLPFIKQSSMVGCHLPDETAG